MADLGDLVFKGLTIDFGLYLTANWKLLRHWVRE